MSQGKLWLNEALFWLHFLIILGGILMGLVLPWWLAISAVIAHRLHLRIFDGCAFSHFQKKTNSLAHDRDYLQDLSLRLFGYHLAKTHVKIADRSLVTTSLVTIVLSYFGLGWVVITLLAVLIAAYGIYKSWQMLQKPARDVCQVNADCSDVKSSAYSSLFGIPVELLGIGYFGILGVLQLLLALNNFQPATLQTIVTSLVILGVTSSAVFIFLQAKIIKAMCSSCMSVHGASFSLATIQLASVLA